MSKGQHKSAFLEESRYIYPVAQMAARRHGFDLRKLTKLHYIMVSPGRTWIYDLFPGSQIHRPEMKRPRHTPKLTLGVGWDLYDAVLAMIPHAKEAGSLKGAATGS